LFWNRFSELCVKRKKTPTSVVSDLGLARGAVTKWKNGTLPNKTTLSKIASYFGVTTDYFFSENAALPLAPEQVKLLDSFARCTDEQRDLIFKLFQTWGIE